MYTFLICNYLLMTGQREMEGGRSREGKWNWEEGIIIMTIRIISLKWNLPTKDNLTIIFPPLAMGFFRISKFETARRRRRRFGLCLRLQLFVIFGYAFWNFLRNYLPLLSVGFFHLESRNRVISKARKNWLQSTLALAASPRAKTSKRFIGSQLYVLMGQIVLIQCRSLRLGPSTPRHLLPCPGGNLGWPWEGGVWPFSSYRVCVASRRTFSFLPRRSAAFL